MFSVNHLHWYQKANTKLPIETCNRNVTSLLQSKQLGLSIRKGDGRRFGMGEPQWVWGIGSLPAGSRAGAPLGGLGTKSPEAEEF